MKFTDFRLIKIDFSLNPEFKIKAKKVPINPEIAIHHEFRKKQKELVVSLGIRQMTGNMPFYFEVVSAGLFRFEQIPESVLLKQFATINCPAILFPYVRETIADLTRRSGFPPLHLNPINFIELAKKKKRKRNHLSRKPI
ncbi:MAG: hypothetical protein A2Y66_05385 [Nitrospirae bacterium RBG_13_41_22]|nr:MAG: hypothetical protein A2Y66_05385 [Nitrospirae bacterium RBG_13_41_22]